TMPIQMRWWQSCRRSLTRTRSATSSMAEGSRRMEPSRALSARADCSASSRYIGPAVASLTAIEPPFRHLPGLLRAHLGGGHRRQCRLRRRQDGPHLRLLRLGPGPAFLRTGLGRANLTRGLPAQVVQVGPLLAVEPLRALLRGVLGAVLQ